MDVVAICFTGGVELVGDWTKIILDGVGGEPPTQTEYSSSSYSSIKNFLRFALPSPILVGSTPLIKFYNNNLSLVVRSRFNSLGRCAITISYIN